MPAKKVDKRDEVFAGAIGRHIAAKHLTREGFASRLGIRRETLRNWTIRPELVPLGYLRLMAVTMSDDEILEIVKYGSGCFESLHENVQIRMEKTRYGKKV